MTVHKAEEAVERAVDAREHAVAKMDGLKICSSANSSKFKDSTVASMKELVDDLNQRLPALREAGYTLAGVSVEIGLIPKVVATFDSADDISEERVEAVIAEHQDAKVTTALLRSLYTAYKLQNAVHIAGMKPRGISLELGLTPAIAVRFA